MTSSQRNVKPSLTELWDSGQISKEYSVISNKLEVFALCKTIALKDIYLVNCAPQKLSCWHDNIQIESLSPIAPPHPVAECIHAFLKKKCHRISLACDLFVIRQ